MCGRRGRLHFYVFFCVKGIAFEGALYKECITFEESDCEFLFNGWVVEWKMGLGAGGRAFVRC